MLTKEIYGSWCIWMKALLRAYDVWEMVESRVDEKEDVAATKEERPKGWQMWEARVRYSDM